MRIFWAREAEYTEAQKNENTRNSWRPACGHAGMQEVGNENGGRVSTCPDLIHEESKYHVLVAMEDRIGRNGPKAMCSMEEWF